jgi:hydroxylamine reductase
MFHRLVTRGLPSRVSTITNATRRTNVTKLAMPSSYATTRPLSTQVQFDNNKTMTNPDMFCRQCEQTKDHVACTSVGVCGKTAETSAMQDALLHVIKSVSLWASAARDAGATPEQLHDANLWTIRAAFSTMTNVNFSETQIAEFVQEGMRLKKLLEPLAAASSAPPTDGAASLDVSDVTLEELESFGHSVSVPLRQAQMGNKDCFSLNEIGTYGIKGACAYAAHCYQLGKMDDDVMADIHQVYAKLASDEPDMEGLLANALKVGEINGRILAMLDDAHVTAFGVPEPTQVKTTASKGKAILISGHDLKDLEVLLQQTEGTDVHVYTHGEMLPAHGYPGLNKYPHLKGNYGTAWQNQKFEFSTFPGPIVVTTNCILEPRRAYRNRLYTMNEVGLDGVQHIGQDRDFSHVIEQAQHMKGFRENIEPAHYHTVGFNHRAVLPLANQVIEAAQSGALSRIVLIGGCDGSQWDRK